MHIGHGSTYIGKKHILISVQYNKVAINLFFDLRILDNMAKNEEDDRTRRLKNTAQLRGYSISSWDFLLLGWSLYH